MARQKFRFAEATAFTPILRCQVSLRFRPDYDITLASAQTNEMDLKQLCAIMEAHWRVLDEITRSVDLLKIWYKILGQNESTALSAI